MDRPPKISREMRDRWAREQNKLKAGICKHDAVDWTLAGGCGLISEPETSVNTLIVALVPKQENTLHLIGGLDISFYKNAVKQKEAIAALIVITYPDMKVVYEDFQDVDLTVPYKAGFLAFRECPAYHKLLERVSKTQFNPQVLMVDANGILHPRGCGCASHLGVESGYPTIGVAKNLHCVDGLETEQVEAKIRHRMSKNKGKGYMPLVGRTRGILGAAMYGHGPGQGTKMPLYVSIGHRLSLESALDLVDKCAKFRIPEPVRQADLRSRRVIKSKEWSPQKGCHQGQRNHPQNTQAALVVPTHAKYVTSSPHTSDLKIGTKGPMEEKDRRVQEQKKRAKFVQRGGAGMSGGARDQWKIDSQEKGKMTHMKVKTPEGGPSAGKNPTSGEGWTVVGSRKTNKRKAKHKRPMQQ